MVIILYLSLMSVCVCVCFLKSRWDLMGGYGKALKD